MALTLKQALAMFWEQIQVQFVKRENGKGLSTNDFTTEEKNKLASLKNTTIDTTLTISNAAADAKTVGDALAELETAVDNFEIPNSNLVNGQYSFGSLRTITSAEESEDDYVMGSCAFAEGDQTKASGESSHAEGSMTTASGVRSHAEGSSTIASGTSSHAEGVQTIANGDGSHAEGWWTIANGDSQHVQGRHNIADEEGNYAHIVGNGMWEEQLSNAHTLDWSGNAWFAGDVYVGSTSGTNKDEGSKKLATEDFVTSAYGTITEAEVDEICGATLISIHEVSWE